MNETCGVRPYTRYSDVSDQRQKLFYGQSGVPNQSTECPNGQFLMLRDREIDPNIRLHHHDMTAHLTYLLPADLLAGDIG